MKIFNKSLVKPLSKSILAFGIVAVVVGGASQGGSFKDAEYRADQAVEVVAHAFISECQNSFVRLSAPCLYSILD